MGVKNFEVINDKNNIYIDDAYRNYYLKEKIKLSSLEVVARQDTTWVDDGGVKLYFCVLHYPGNVADIYGLGGHFFPANIKYYTDPKDYIVKPRSNPFVRWVFPASDVVGYIYHDKFEAYNVSLQMKEPLYLTITLRADGHLPSYLNGTGSSLDYLFQTSTSLDKYNPNRYQTATNATLDDINLYVFTSDEREESEMYGLQVFDGNKKMVFGNNRKPMKIFSNGDARALNFTDAIAGEIEMAILSRYRYYMLDNWAGGSTTFDTFWTYSDIYDDCESENLYPPEEVYFSSIITKRKGSLHLGRYSTYDHKGGILDFLTYYGHSYDYPFILDVTGY